jgi:ribosomal protein S18 acetylase RimI-like enzyme
VKVALRSYRPEDFEALHLIDQACYSSDTAYSRAELRTYLAFPGADCIVAEMRGGRGPQEGHVGAPTSGKIIGFCLSVHRGTGGHIVTMDVLKPWRRHGIGSAILAEIEKRLAKAGVGRVSLETATDNPAGIAFWRKHGYRSCGVKRGYYPRGRDAYAMSKSLADLRQE